jgi:hypothetical protein
MPTSDIRADNLIRAVANGVVPFMSQPADRFSAAMDAATYPILGRGAPGETLDDRFRKNVATEAARTQAFQTEHTRGANGVISAIPSVPKFPSSEEIIRNGPREYVPASPFSSLFSKLPTYGNPGYNTTAGTGQVDASNADSPSSNSLADTLSGTARRMFPTLFASPEGAQQ